MMNGRWRPRHAFAALLATTIVTIWIVALVTALSEFRKEHQQDQDMSRAAAGAIYTRASDMLTRIKIGISQIPARFRSPDDVRPDLPVVTNTFERLAAIVPDIAGLIMIMPDGTTPGKWGTPPMPGPGWETTAYGLGDGFLLWPERTATGPETENDPPSSWALIYKVQQGPAAGALLVARLTPNTYSAFFSGLRAPDGARHWILASDGAILFTNGPARNRVNQMLINSLNWDEAARQVSGPLGPVTTPDGQQRFLFARRIHDTAVWVASSYQRRILWEDIFSLHRPEPAAALLATILLLASGVAIWQAMRRNEIYGLLLAEKERESRRLSLVAHSGANIITLYGADGRVLWVNDTFEQQLGFPQAGALGRRLWDLPGLEESDPTSLERLRSGLLAGEMIQEELTRRTRGGETRFVQINIQPVNDPMLPEVKGFAIETDISAYRRLTVELQGAISRAEAATQVKSNFLAHMSHELRTPLNAILGFSDLMIHKVGGKPLDSAYEGYVRDIHKSGLHLLSLVNDLLQLNQVESGQVELFESEIDPTLLIDDVLRSVAPLLTQRNLSTTLAMADGRRVRADERQIRQVLLNFLSNAIKFTNPGGFISVTVTADPAGGQRIAVRDTGMGIAPVELKQLLSPQLGRGPAMRKQQGQGAGLGLLISREIAARHGGRIEIESAPGIGTTIALILPENRLLPPLSAATGTTG